MVVPPIPVSRYLVPPEPAQLPDDFVRIEHKLLQGLPHSVQLGGDAVAMLIVPTGLALIWREADPLAVVSSDDRETAPRAMEAHEIGATGRAPARLLVRQASGEALGTVPLAIGVMHLLPGNGSPTPGVRLELIVLGWHIRAGNLRGPGDFGGRMSLAWRRADRGAENFEAPPVHPGLRQRLAPEQRIESDLGYHVSQQSLRFRKGFAQ